MMRYDGMQSVRVASTLMSFSNEDHEYLTLTVIMQCDGIQTNVVAAVTECIVASCMSSVSSLPVTSSIFR